MYEYVWGEKETALHAECVPVDFPRSCLRVNVAVDPPLVCFHC